MKAIIRQWYSLQKELDEMGLGMSVTLEGEQVISTISSLLIAGYNVQILQFDNLNVNADTVIYVCKKGEKFVQK